MFPFIATDDLGVDIPVTAKIPPDSKRNHMRPNFRPLRGLVISFLLISLVALTLAADKKPKSAEAEAASKTKAKSTQKADPKQQAKSSRNLDKKTDQNKQQLARKKKDDEKLDKWRGKETALTAKQREAESRKTGKNAKSEAEKKNQKDNGQLAKRELEKKAEKIEKKDTAAKKQPLEKNAKTKSDAKAEIATAKIKPGSKSAKQESKSESPSRIEANKKSKRDTSTENNSLAKLETNKTKPDFRAESHYEAKDEKAKELPAVKFSLRPIAKVAPKVELKFSLARAVAGNSFDAPPPQDHGPDVIDVIEHNSSESGRLDDVLRSEMKTMQFSGVPSNSRRKMDVGKMDAERIKQIQEALAKKGYYAGEISGQYDDLTIEAMRRFQETHKVDVTGYATAQSLRLLGLTDW
jgi:Putative peptidoglycan binding domain